MSLEEWRQLPLNRDRDKHIVDEQWVHVNPGAIDQDDEAGSVAPFKPEGDGWFYAGSRGWVGPGTTRVMSFNTTSFDLEEGDVYVGPGLVLWRDADSIQGADPSEVTITRGGDNRVMSVIRKPKV